MQFTHTSIRLPVSSLPTKDRPAVSRCDIMSGLTCTVQPLLVYEKCQFFPLKEGFIASCKHNVPHIYDDVAHQ